MNTSDRPKGEASVRAEPDPSRGTWRLCRQDDNGNIFVIETFRDRTIAQRRRDAFEAMGHKQTYWIELIKKPA